MDSFADTPHRDHPPRALIPEVGRVLSLVSQEGVDEQEHRYILSSNRGTIPSEGHRRNTTPG